MVHPFKRWLLLLVMCLLTLILLSGIIAAAGAGLRRQQRPFTRTAVSHPAARPT